VAEPLISAGTTTDAGVPRLFKLISSIQSGQRVPHPSRSVRRVGVDDYVLQNYTIVARTPTLAKRKDGHPLSGLNRRDQT